MVLAALPAALPVPVARRPAHAARCSPGSSPTGSTARSAVSVIEAVAGDALAPGTSSSPPATSTCGCAGSPDASSTSWTRARRRTSAARRSTSCSAPPSRRSAAHVLGRGPDRDGRRRPARGSAEIVARRWHGARPGRGRPRSSGACRARSPTAGPRHQAAAAGRRRAGAAARLVLGRRAARGRAAGTPDREGGMAT